MGESRPTHTRRGGRLESAGRVGGGGCPTCSVRGGGGGSWTCSGRSVGNGCSTRSRRGGRGDCPTHTTGSGRGSSEADGASRRPASARGLGRLDDHVGGDPCRMAGGSRCRRCGLGDRSGDLGDRHPWVYGARGEATKALAAVRLHTAVEPGGGAEYPAAVVAASVDVDVPLGHRAAQGRAPSTEAVAVTGDLWDERPPHAADGCGRDGGSGSGLRLVGELAGVSGGCSSVAGHRCQGAHRGDRDAGR